MEVQRGVHRNTHKACLGQCARPARSRKGCLKKRLRFPSKSFFMYCFKWLQNFSLEKQMTFPLFGVYVLFFIRTWFMYCFCVRVLWFHAADPTPLTRFHGFDFMGPNSWIRFHWFEFICPIPLIRFHWFDSIDSIHWFDAIDSIHCFGSIDSIHFSGFPWLF